jgi:hypothetical protein
MIRDHDELKNLVHEFAATEALQDDLPFSDGIQNDEADL